MRFITTKGGDFISCLDKINEINVENTSLKQKLFNNHVIDANEGRRKGQLSLEQLFGFCKTFENVSKNLGFHLTFKTIGSQDIIFTTLWDAFNITIIILYLYVPIFFPSPKTQAMFNDSNKKHCKIS